MDENISEAMQMVFGVMVFVIALSLSISFFSQARVTAASVIEARDRETWATDVEYEEGQIQRIVGVETIIPTIYRALAENYKIYFYESDGTTPLPILKKDGQEINYIALGEKIDNKNTIDNLIAQAINYDKNTFLDILIGGTTDFDSTVQAEKETKKGKFEEMGFDFSLGTLYNILEGQEFEEKLGEYYIDPETTVESMLSSKRIITYIKK